MVAKGLINDPMGNLLPPVTQSLNQGFSPMNYFDAAAGSRRGVIDRSLNTAHGGYAYRKMIYALGSTEADITNADCGTKRFAKIKITKDLFSRMQGRYVVGENHRSVIPISENMIGTVIKLRSPIFCKSRKICRTCYGDLLYQVKTSNVGIVSAQEVTSLSEKIMKSFHTGGGAEVSRVNIFKELMVNVEDNLESSIKSMVKQVENDLITLSNATTIVVDKNIYVDKYQLEYKPGIVKLPLGYFTLNIGNISIPVTSEKPALLYKNDSYVETDKTITISYNAGDKMLYFEPFQLKAEKIAQHIDVLVGGQSPWTTPESLYMKFYTTLEHFSNWDSVHLEVIISSILRNKENPQIPARLKEPYEPSTHSIKNLPSLISWPLGLAFENFSKSITYGMISDRADPSQIEKVIFGEPLSDLSIDLIKKEAKARRRK